MKILTLTTPDISNGIGCRVSLWFAGCRHHCEGCQNKHTWDYNQGSDITDENVRDRIYSEMKPYIKGITITGGDPLCQTPKSLNELKEFLVDFKAKFPDKDIWIYTGYTYEEICDDKNKYDVMKLCDILVDGEYVCNKHVIDLPFRGSTNQRIIDIKKTIDSKDIITLSI